MSVVIGWDIGGAHVKCARAVDGRILDVRQTPCQLWLGVDNLAKAFTDLSRVFADASLHAVTMTGELAEIFATRAEGVGAIASTMSGLAAQTSVAIYAGRSGFLSPAEAAAAPDDVASANWHATAALAALCYPEALLIDIGSTTTDIIPIRDAVSARGYTDAERLATGELIYAGVVRTSVMAVVADAPYAGARQRLMAENFATMADVYRMTGELRADEDQYPASDGRGKSLAECRARLARMLGRDAASSADAALDDFARYIRERQISMIYDAAAQALSGVPLNRQSPVIGAGAGDFLAQEIAARLRRPYVSFNSLLGSEAPRAAVLCAPAAAVAILGASWLTAND